MPFVDEAGLRAHVWRQVGVLAIAAAATCAVIIVLLLVVVNRTSDLNPLGPPLSSDARNEIEHANCKQLVRLDWRYAANGDSVEPDMTGLRLTEERIAELHCPLPPLLQPASH
jgi:hypothetical protein